ncbi:hypothetical protein FWG95_00610 [Candidatus Saccharibacteria bacterium]|nr:hypothetical protein [Candidatus Saccharibacteria bacterium]
MVESVLSVLIGLLFVAGVLIVAMSWNDDSPKGKRRTNRGILLLLSAAALSACTAIYVGVVYGWVK